MQWRTCSMSTILFADNNNSIDTLTMSSQTAGEGGGEDSEWKKGGARFTRSVWRDLYQPLVPLTDHAISKRNSEYFDPCQEAADRSLKCLRRNGGDRAMCMDYFDAYKACKKQWVWQ
ncbi:hypothetical protein AC579_8588 [Pseudocercospora musae]|uniref:CHCH domain-containing protein n=1 Tax=Pseudocercospora musae TaxID=113226 RepID=A0A139IBF7_9PEZI|nr:hypothetical protein AC579_8588 [Pseudocercospora musae]